MNRLIRTIRKLLERFQGNVADPGSVAENENFIALIRAAQEDESVRKKVVGMASIAEDFHRCSLISEYQRLLRQRKAPQELIESIEFLKDRPVCAKVREILE